MQFHPEFTEAIMKAYLEVQFPDIVAEGLDAQSLLQGVRPAPDANHLLKLFAEYLNARAMTK